MAALINVPGNIVGLSISEAYENDDCFAFLLNRAAIAANEIARLNNEGFTNMKSLVDTFSTTKALEDTIKDLNKTFGALGRTNANHVYFNIRAAKNLYAIHYYVSRCLALNKIPDIRIIDIPGAVTYMENRIIASKDDDNLDTIKIPVFNGDNWIQFRDKFIVQLRNTNGTKDIPLEYVIRQE